MSAAIAEHSPVRRVVAHAYPWDVLGDPAFIDRTLALGVRRIALAAAYHAVRAATPLHPDHQLVDAQHAALYRRVRPEAWSDQPLRPRAAAWMADDDSFALAAGMLRDAGFEVDAWIVANHTSALGQKRLEFSVVNCFGDRYPYAMCPHVRGVRAYAATLAAEAVRDLPLSGVLLEAWGQQGVTHNSLHEKTDGAWDPATTRLLSICCCRHCRADWADRGLDSGAVVDTLRRTVHARQHGEPEPTDRDVAGRAMSSLAAMSASSAMSMVLGEDVAQVVLASRLDAFASSLAGMLSVLPRSLHVSAFGGDDDWSGAPLACFTPDIDQRVDTVVQGAWALGRGTVDAVGRVRARVPGRTSIAAYVTVLPPMTREALIPHVQALLAAGATDLHLYHLGLAGTERLSWLSELTRSAGVVS